MNTSLCSHSLLKCCSLTYLPTDQFLCLLFYFFVSLGREEVKTLVDLAMMSAGESDIETDRVSYLHTTALGFAPFIFDLDKSADLSQLINVCERVWEEIKGNGLLPKQLVKYCFYCYCLQPYLSYKEVKPAQFNPVLSKITKMLETCSIFTLPTFPYPVLQVI